MIRQSSLNQKVEIRNMKMDKRNAAIVNLQSKNR